MLEVLLKAEAARFSGWELAPLVAVAVPVAGKLSMPRIVPAPFTSSVVAGVIVLMPILNVRLDRLEQHRVDRCWRCWSTGE